jgi:hypothetical protein
MAGRTAAFLSIAHERADKTRDSDTKQSRDTEFSHGYTLTSMTRLRRSQQV